MVLLQAFAIFNLLILLANSVSYSSAAVTCKNGGIVINLNDKTTCLCDSSYGGETCDDYLCENNGTKVTNGCKCPEGFSGSHCQNVICDNSAKLKSINSDHNNLVFIVRAQKQLATIVNNIATFIPDNKDCLPEYIQQYALVAFSEGQILRKEVYPTANAFQQAVHEVMKTNVSLSTCEDFVLITLHDVLNDQKIVNNRSTIYIITDATPQRYHDTAAKLKVMVSNKYNIPIYVVLFYKNSCSTGLGPRRWFDLSQTELNYVVAASSGQIFDYWIDSNEYINVLRDHIQFTYFRSNLAYGIYGCRTRFDDFPEGCCCENPHSMLSVDHNNTTVSYIASWFNDDRAKVKNQLGRNEPNNIRQNTTHSQIKFLKSLPIGQYWNDYGDTFNGSRTAYRLYEGPEVCASKPTYNIFWGFATDRIIDKSLVQPLEDLPLALVVRMNGLKVNDPKLLRADLFVYYQHISNMIYMSSGIWREECTFQLYFQPTKYPPKKALSFTLYVANGMDLSIQRSGNFYGLESLDLICDHGGKIDVKCYCEKGWTGVDCSLRICQHGGLYDALNHNCLCPEGYYGSTCNKVVRKTTTALPTKHSSTMTSSATSGVTSITVVTPSDLPIIETTTVPTKTASVHAGSFVASTIPVAAILMRRT